MTRAPLTSAWLAVCTWSRYLPTLFGTSCVLRVRSGLICFQLIPPSIVFHNTLVAKKSDFWSTCENTIGCVRT